MITEKDLVKLPTNGSQFAAFIHQHQVDLGLFGLASGLHRRTITRYLTTGQAPAWAWYLAYSLAGFVLDKSFQGWQIDQGQLWHTQAPATRYQGLSPATLFDLAYSLQYSHTLARNSKDLARENSKLRELLHQAKIKHSTPKNLVMFPGVQVQDVIKLSEG